MPRSPMAVMAHRVTVAGDPDFFPTPPWAARAIGQRIKILDPAASSVWEPACGGGHMVHGLRSSFDQVIASDLCVYGGHHFVHDFIGSEPSPVVADWIVTNPPFGDALPAFIRRAYAEAKRGVAMFARAGLLEGQERHGLLFGDCPLTLFCPFSERVPIHRNRWDADGSSAAFYGVYIWLKDPFVHKRMTVDFAGMRLPAIMPFEPGQKSRWTRANDAAFACGGAL